MNRRSFKNRPLSDQELNQIVPSAFAQQPWYAQSDRYAFVPTSQIIAGLREAGFLPFNAIQSRTRVEGKEFFTRHSIRFRSLNEALNAVGDTAVEVVMVNSHDGTSQYEISLGAFRLACLNGMMVSEGAAEIIKVRHTGNIIQSVIDATQNLIEQAPKVAEAIKLWKTIDLKPVEARILAEEAHSLRFDGETLAPKVDALLQPRRHADSGTDLWTTFNRIQENAVEGGLRRVDENGLVARNQVTGRRAPRTRAVSGISENTKLNRALWSLADKMAKIKAGE